LPTVEIPKQHVKLANGEWLATTRQVKGLQWYIQGHTFITDLIVLDLLPYDTILGYDWLKENSPMQCDWMAKTLQLQYMGKTVTLEGLQQSPLTVDSISATQLFKSIKGNNIWAYVMVDSPASTNATKLPPDPPQTEELHDLLLQYANIFQDPKHLPPHRSYDHDITLLPDVVPINSRSYHYSPQHKIEIENQVK